MARAGLTFEWRGVWSLEQRTDIRRVGFQARNLDTGEVRHFATIGALRSWVTRRVKRDLRQVAGTAGSAAPAGGARLSSRATPARWPWRA